MPSLKLAELPRLFEGPKDLASFMEVTAPALGRNRVYDPRRHQEQIQAAYFGSFGTFRPQRMHGCEERYEASITDLAWLGSRRVAPPWPAASPPFRPAARCNYV